MATVIKGRARVVLDIKMTDWTAQSVFLTC